ncbi:unnamed protein product, partial [Allacma fusca]
AAAGTFASPFECTMSSMSFLLVLAIASASVQAAEHFCYDEVDCGPAHWSGDCKTGTQQSPVVIPSSWSPFNIFATDTITFNNNYKQSVRNAYIFNNGHTVQITVSPDVTSSMTFTSTLTGGPSEVYVFGQVHCHWGGSEHVYENVGRTDMECHIVHHHANYTSVSQAAASGKTGALAIFGILYTTSSTLKPVDVLSPDETIQFFPTNCPKVRDPKSGTQIMTGNINIYGMIPRVTSGPGLLGARQRYQVHVHKYMGSLTTPGCNEGMHWFVMRHVRQISVPQLDAFKSLLDGEDKPLNNNFRPPQPLNGRIIRQVVMNELQPATTTPQLSPIWSWGNSFFSFFG